MALNATNVANALIDTLNKLSNVRQRLLLWVMTVGPLLILSSELVVRVAPR